MRNKVELIVGAAAVLLTLGALLRLNSPSQSHGSPDSDSAQLSARLRKLEPLVDRVDEVERALLAHAKSNRERFDALASAPRPRPAVERRQAASQEATAASVVVGAGYPTDSRTDCATAVLPKGLQARTKEEAMKKSKEDKQYGNGIQQNKNKPNNLVDSADYWEKRYAMGGNSGAGSYNQIGVFKAEIMNNFVKENKVKTVIEFGFGDGQQLTRATYPHYIGLDVSKTIHAKTSKRFEGDSTKEFRLYDGDVIPGLKEDLTLSFDVIYHLVEDEVYHKYMAALFAASTKYVVVYSSNIDGWHGAAHVLHRDNTKYIAENFPDWRLLGTLRNKYAARTAQDFFFYGKCD